MKRTLLILALFLSGCGLTVQQKADTSRIAKATSAAGTFSTDHLVDLRSAIIRLQVASYKIDPKAKCVDTPAGPCVIPLDRGISAKDMEARLAVSQALAAYGNALDALINADRSSEILNAANELGDAVGSAADKSASLTLNQDDLNAISALTALAGRWHLEHKRKEALLALAKGYAQTVHQVTPLLERDFALQWNSPCLSTFRDGPTKDAPNKGTSKEAGILDVYCRAAYTLKRKAKRVIDNTATEHDIRVDAVDSYMLADNAQTNGALLSEKGVALLKQLDKSAAELEKVATDNKYQSKDIKQLGKDVKTLTSSLKLLIHAQ